MNGRVAFPAGQQDSSLPSNRHITRQLLTLLLALLIGGSAIWMIRQPWAAKAFWPWLPLLLAMFVGASALRGLELWLREDPLQPHLAAYAAPRRRIIGAAGVGIGLACVAGVVIRLWPDYNNWHGLPAVWAAGLAFLLAGAWLLGAVGHASPRAAMASSPWTDSRRTRWLEAFAFVLILALAVLLRAYHFNSIPPGIFVDETNSGLDALHILEGRDVSPFTTGWYETPNGYIYYMAAIFKFFGATWLGLKLVSLIPAVLAVAALYVLARALFGPLTGLISMLLLAVSRWHLTMSRWGWNETAPPFFQILSIFFLIRGLRERRALDYALGGLFMGLGVYTYLSSRLAVATIILYVLYWFVSEPTGFVAGLRRSWLGIAIMALAALAAVAPLGVTYLHNPFLLNNRISEVNVFRDVQQQHSWAPLAQNVLDTLRFFHQRGDMQGRHNLPGEPMLDPVTGLLFAIGTAYAILAMRDHRRVLLLFWLLIGLSGSYLGARSESPQAYRSLTALPAVVMIAADVLERAGRSAYCWLQSRQAGAQAGALSSLISASIILFALAGASAWETRIYFGAQATSIAVLRSFGRTETDVANETVSALRSGRSVYLSPTYAGFSPVQFLVFGAFHTTIPGYSLDQPPYHVIVPELELPLPDQGRDAVMLLDTTYWPVRSFISSMYPEARIELMTIPDGSPNYMRVSIPRAQIAALQGLAEDVTYVDGHHERFWVDSVQPVRSSSQVSEVTWIGSIRIDRSGRYRLQGSSGLQVLIAGEAYGGEGYFGQGLYPLRVTSPGNTAGDASLMWSSGEEDLVPVPPQALFRLQGSEQGLLASYWDNAAWSGTPVFHEVTPFLLLSWPNGSPVGTGGPFSARFTGLLHVVESGHYDFRVEADDGARLTLDGKVLGEGLTAGQANSFEASAELQSGDHPIVIDYFQQGGGSALRLLWRRSTDEPWSPVPPDVLTPAQP